MQGYKIVTDPTQIARDNDLLRSKVEIGAAVGVCPRPAPKKISKAPKAAPATV